MKKLTILFTIIAVLFASSCDRNNKNNSNMNASNVEMRNIDGKYRLYVDNAEFYVNGAGCECWNIASLAEHGANSFRTWMDSDEHRDGLEMLDEAYENGLMITMGLKLGRERHGFNYDSTEAVQAQFEEIKKTVLKYKDHPALLAWGIGNELNLRATNLKVWDAVDEISKMIHEIDGMHPTTTMMAGIGKTEVDYLKQINTDLDFISIQMYGDIVNLKARLEEAGYDGPYLVTEWGTTGHWEMPSTEWGAAIEQTSSEKAEAVIERYETVIKADVNNCLGSYVFLWGQKQERTPTWYGLYTENGEEMETIGAMHYLWTGEWPENRSPSIISASLDGKGRFDNIKLSPGKEYTTKVVTTDPDSDSLNIRLEILLESTDLKDGGDLENRPDRVSAAIMELRNGEFTIDAPVKPGAYRLFIYILDQHNHAATVNIPFFVE